ncbi:hypothetical protein [Streptomyces sp. NPDC048191]|uniref:hypothetical protein n=1 Tax=Streptomyces sp. NPDC048191 TaxID=3155484 RepID=UPI0033C43AA3
MTDDFMGPPWQADWTQEATGNYNALPPQARAMVEAARAELVIAKDPWVDPSDAAGEQRQALTAGVRDDWPDQGGEAVQALGSGRGGHGRGGLRQPGAKLFGGFTVGDLRQDTVLARRADADGGSEQAGTGRVLTARPGHAQHTTGFARAGAAGIAVGRAQ